MLGAKTVNGPAPRNVDSSSHFVDRLSAIGGVQRADILGGRTFRHQGHVHGRVVLPNANSVDVIARVRQEIDQIKRELPTGIGTLFTLFIVPAVYVLIAKEHRAGERASADASDVPEPNAVPHAQAATAAKSCPSRVRREKRRRAPNARRAIARSAACRGSLEMRRGPKAHPPVTPFAVVTLRGAKSAARPGHCVITCT